MPITNHHDHSRIGVRLLASELTMLDDLKSKLATPIMPRPSASAVLRAGLYALARTAGAVAPQVPA